MTTSLAAERPRSPIAVLRREDKELLDQLAPELPTRIRTCAAQLIPYFTHWQKWKAANYPTQWIYQPLRHIREDLMKVFSIHVIRTALSLLQQLGYLSIRKNSRDLNWRNGQDKTHQYLLNVELIKAAQKKLASSSMAETLENSPFVNSETSCSNSEILDVNSEISRFAVETHTQIPSPIPASNSYSLSKEREKLNFVQEEELEDFWAVDKEVEQEVLASFSNTQEIPREQKDSGEDQFSAAPEPKCSEVVQPELKPLPKLKSDRVSGFRSNAERDVFYKALLELGKTQGKKSPAAWSTKIVKSIDAGEPCHYLSEYRDGQQVGSCEQQEWEIAPGQVFPRFISYLTTRLKKAEMTDEQAIVTAHQQLKDVNLARSLWESCKRYIAKYQEDWEKQKQLGVQNAYLPPELLPEREVNVEQVGSAIASLQDGSIQLQGLPESAKLTSATTELEPANEVSTDPAPEPPSPVELQEKLNSPLQAPLARMMARNAGYRIEEDLVLPAGEEMPSLEYLRSLLNTENRALTAKKIQRLIEGNPQWGFYFDEFEELWGF
ncbi:hypothetical protein AVDCRST_MAG92-2693 [uncultured Coleofasciculus sp.]|uniref:Uncharacterized protein n=1 Tax=uncultured Coleofasciculus sp. TaxID=1267456 RepID=A0A6J4J2R1_9CYAN|nr:hypothetical protein AVDCRST_MAG92-2693 [uncultured Coleofasciculus sp.]